MASQLERQQAELARYLLQRRAVLKGGAAALAGAAALPSLGRPAAAAPAEPMQFIGWQYQPEIVAENVEHLQQALRRERQLRAGARRVPRRRRDQADRRPAHRHDVFRGGPADPLEHGRLERDPRRPAGHRGDQGRDVPDQRPQHVAGRTAAWAACPTTPASIPSSATRSISTRPSSSRRRPGRSSSTSAAS